MNTAWKKFTVGSSHGTSVEAAHIADSDPCNKDNCMLTRSLTDTMSRYYDPKEFKIKSTNHGAIIYLKGRRITTVFDTGTAKKIFTYDRTFKKTHSRARALASVRPFKAKLMVESNVATPTSPPMSEETKKKLAEARRAQGKKDYHPTRKARARELSL